MAPEQRSIEPSVWPDKLRIRDTGLHDDMGGGGQRIYTTAGSGYETKEYVRADAGRPGNGEPPLAQQCYHEGCRWWDKAEEIRRLREEVERLAAQIKKMQAEARRVFGV